MARLQFRFAARLRLVALALGLAGCGDDLDGDGFASSDCADGDASVHPGAAELCDGIDNDCDGLVDESDSVDAGIFYPDSDGDGHGQEDAPVVACAMPQGHVSRAGDCDDRDPEVHPDALELCDGIDNDCEGSIDQDARDSQTWYRDADGDGYGDADETADACEAPAGHVDNGEDCDDLDFLHQSRCHRAVRRHRQRLQRPGRWRRRHRPPHLAPRPRRRRPRRGQQQRAQLRPAVRLRPRRPGLQRQRPGDQPQRRRRVRRHRQRLR